jgi:hypothetical protein
MLSVDFIGLLFTIGLVGPRYPLHVLAAAVIHDLGRILVILFFHGRIEAVVAAGAFGTAVTSGLKGYPAVAAAFGGPFISYLVSSGAGGVAWERTASLVSPAARLRQPFAVVNFRLAVLSALAGLWQLL